MALEIDGDLSVETPEEKSEIEIVNEFKRGKYNYVPISELEWAYEKALYLYLSRVFPFHHNIVTVPEDRARDNTLIKWIMRETLAMNGIMEDAPLQSYKENGMSFTFSADLLSPALLKSFPLPVGVVMGSRK